jgi:hypothetical protein
VNIAQYIFQKIVILVKSPPILYVLIPVIPAKFCRYLPVLKSPEYRKTGFGIAGIGNTSAHALATKMMFWTLARVSFRAVKIVSCNKEKKFHGLPATMISIVYGSPAAGSGNKRAASIGGLGR